MIGAELFIQLAQIIIIATGMSLLLRKLNQPSIFAYILAGIIIGPLVIGSINLTDFNLPFVLGLKEITPEIKLLSELGAAFLLFSIGIETSVKRLLKTGAPLIAGTFMQVIGVILVTLALTFFTGLLDLETAIFVGAIVAFSSTMIVIKILSDKKETNTLSGRITITILLIQDFLIILFVPLLQNMSKISDPLFFIPVLLQTLILLAIALISNKYLFPKLFAVASKENELFFLSSISTALIFIALSFLLNIPVTIGAFIGGLALSNLPYNTAVFSKIRALRDFFLTIFFVSLGASLTFNFSGLSFELMAAIVLIIFVFKPIIFFIVGLISGYGSRIGFEVGLNLAQVSEFGFVIAGIGLATIQNGNSILSLELFSFIVGISAFSMIITPHLMNFAPKASSIFSNKLNKIFNFEKVDLFNKNLAILQNVPDKKNLKNHLIIIGGGIIGRRLARKFSINNKALIIDSNPETVIQGQKDGLNFVYSTAEDTELLEKLDFVDAKAVIITVPHKNAMAFIQAIKKISPKIKILVFTTHFYNAIELYEKGVDFVSLNNLNGVEEMQRVLNVYEKTNKIFFNEKVKQAHLKYISSQATEEKNYQNYIIS